VETGPLKSAGRFFSVSRERPAHSLHREPAATNAATSGAEDTTMASCRLSGDDHERGLRRQRRDRPTIRSPSPTRSIPTPCGPKPTVSITPSTPPPTAVRAATHDPRHAAAPDRRGAAAAGRDAAKRRPAARRLVAASGGRSRPTAISGSDLHRWQQVLDVPVAELLVEGEGQLSGPVLERSRMVKLMKTAAAIRERTSGTPVGKIVGMLIEQILEIMPELKDVTPWHTTGQRPHARRDRSHQPNTSSRKTSSAAAADRPREWHGRLFAGAVLITIPTSSPRCGRSSSVSFLLGVLAITLVLFVTVAVDAG